MKAENKQKKPRIVVVKKMEVSLPEGLPLSGRELEEYWLDEYKKESGLFDDDQESELDEDEEYESVCIHIDDELEEREYEQEYEYESHEETYDIPLTYSQADQAKANQALLLYEKVRQQLKEKVFRQRSKKSQKQILADLLKAERLLKSLQARDPGDDFLNGWLTLLENDLGDLYKLRAEREPDACKKAQRAYQSGLDYAERIPDHSFSFVQGELYQKLSYVLGCSKDISKMEEVKTCLEKCADYYLLYTVTDDIEKRDQDILLARRLALSNLSLLGIMLKGTDNPEAILKHTERMLEILQDLYALDPQNKMYLAALGLCHYQKAQVLQQLPEKSKPGLHGLINQALNLSEDYIREVQKEDLIEYYQWLNLIPDQKVLDALFDPKPESSLAASSLLAPDWQALLAQNPSDLFEKLEEDLKKDVAEQLDDLDQAGQQKCLNLFWEAVEDEAQKAREGKAAREIAFCCSRDYDFYKENDLKRACLDLLEIQIFYLEQDIQNEPDPETREILTELEASVCFELGMGCSDLKKALAAQQRAIELLADLAESHTVISTDFYSGLMLSQALQHQRQGRLEKAGVFKKKAKKVLNQQQWQALKEAFACQDIQSTIH